jgi:hypothetical protein
VKTNELSVIENQIRQLREQLETQNARIRELIEERDKRNEKFSGFIKEAKENKKLRD